MTVNIINLLILLVYTDRIPLAVNSLLGHQLKSDPLVWLQRQRQNVKICSIKGPIQRSDVTLPTWITVPSLSQVTVGGGSPPNQMSYLGEGLRYESSTLILYKELSSIIFQSRE